jgi:hypothetical protein
MSVAASSISDSVDEEKLNDFKLYCTKFSFYAPDPNDPGFRRCQVQGCGSFFKWKPSNGYTTMGSHLVKNHGELLREALANSKQVKPPSVEPGQGTITNYYAYASEEAKNIAGWIELILFENYPLDSCEKKRHPHLAKFVTLKSISRNTVKKYLHLLHEKVVAKIKQVLPKKFVLMLDGWTIKTEHYLGVFASFIDQRTKVKQRFLLSCMVADDVDANTEYTAEVGDNAKHFGLTAEDIYDELYDILKDYGFSDTQLENIEDIVQAIIGDSVSANKKLARIANIPFINCRSHLLNLAINAGIGNPQKQAKRTDDDDIEDDSYDEPELSASKLRRREIIRKCDFLQGCLLTVKGASVLRSHGIDIEPERMNKTRWSSVNTLVRKTLGMYAKKNLAEISFSRKEQTKINKYLLSDADIIYLKELDSKMSKLNMTTVLLQKDNLTLAQCQEAIDFVREQVPDIVHTSNHLSWDYWKDDLDVDDRGRKLHRSYFFTCGVIKIQQGKEKELTRPEERACMSLLKEVMTVNDDQNDEEFEDEQKRDQKRFKRALDERIAAAGQAQSSLSSSRYEDCRHIEGTSDPVERLFSFTKRVMSDSRKHMGPESLNAIACLTINKMFWAEGELMSAQVIQEIMNTEKAKKAAERAALRAQEAYRLMMEEPAELPYDDDYDA